MEDYLPEKSYFENLTFGLVKSLEKRQGVVDIKVDQRTPAERHSIQQWEQKYSCLMPDDLKSFYLANNGFFLSWSVKMNETRVPVGRMEINTLENLLRIGGTSGGSSGSGAPTLCDIDLDYGTEEDRKAVPRFDHRSRIFELDPCDGFGKVCLVYNNTKPGIPAQNAEIWLLDRALGWHLLADTFLTYYRLLLTHLGLPQWQYSLTDIGVTPQAKQWFYMYAPLRLDTVLQENKSKSSPSPNTSLDVNKVFKGKSDKKKAGTLQQAQKKKLPPTMTKNTGVAGRNAALGQQKTMK